MNRGASRGCRLGAAPSRGAGLGAGAPRRSGRAPPWCWAVLVALVPAAIRPVLGAPPALSCAQEGFCADTRSFRRLLASPVLNPLSLYLLTHRRAPGGGAASQMGHCCELLVSIKVSVQTSLCMLPIRFVYRLAGETLCAL